MYQLTDEQIEYIRSDLAEKGIVTEDLRDNLLDHLCCIIENELEESGDFHSFYSSWIRRFYARNLAELEEETQALLIFKNYYAMKKVMLISGITASALISAGILFKFMHWAGAAVILFSGVILLSVLFLPLMFILKIKENVTMKDKVLSVLAAIAAIAMSLAPFFKIMHWRGANMLGMTSIVILVLLFLPVYFVTGIRRPETKLNTIISSVLIVCGVGLFLALIRSPHSTYVQNLRATATFVRGDEILKMERELLESDSVIVNTSSLAGKIDLLCEELKSFIVSDQTGSKALDAGFSKKEMVINDEPVENYFKNKAETKHKLDELKSLVKSYNSEVVNRKQVMLIPEELTVFDEKEDRVVKSLNDLVQIQMMVLQNERAVRLP